MFFSIIIPVYNRANLISRAVDSVLNQSFKNFEIIVIDDGSDDETQKILKRYKSQIKLITLLKNYGVSKARNIGIKEAKGNIIAFLDSDDEYKKDKLKTHAYFFATHPTFKIHQTDERWIKNGQFLNKKKKHLQKEGFIFYPSLKLCLISPSAVAVKKEIFDEVGMFDEDLEVCEDYDLWLRISKKYPIGFSNKEMVIKYGGHDGQLSCKFHSMDLFRIKSIKKHFKQYDKKIIEVFNQKKEILLKGAIKHKNQKLLKELRSCLGKI